MEEKLIKQNGFSLMEIMVSLLIIMILMFGVYNIINLSLGLASDNKFYVEAMEIANQKMEQVYNLPYNDVGTVAGSPTGTIPDYETVIREGSFTVHTLVNYVDDPYDSTLAGTDIIFDDYKIATIEVSWDAKKSAKMITIFSKIIPKTEETSSGNGLLKLLIVDANGNPLPGADIHIENNIFGPALDVDWISDVNGELAYSVPPSFEGFEITVSMPGYGTDRTYSRTVSNPNPSKPHLSVIEGIKTEESFSIDLLSTLQIHTVFGDLPTNWQINTDSSGENQTNAKIIIDSAGFIYVVWEDYRQSSSAKIMAQKYNSTGDAQWPNTSSPDDQSISTANGTVVPDILVDSFGNLYIAWYDDSVGNKESYLVKRDSADGSDLWGSEKKINTLADSDDQSNPRIAITDNGSYATSTITWQDDRNGDEDIYIQIFDSGGSSQLLPEIRANQNTLGDGTNQTNPVIITDSNGNIYTAWADNRDGDLSVYGAKFSSSMVFSWENELSNPGISSNQYEADIAIDSNDYIYLVWTDERNTNSDIYMQKFDVNGSSQWAADVKINIDGDGSNQTQPALAIDSSDDIYIVWTDERNGDQDIYSGKYASDGSSYWSEDLRININTDPSAQYNPDLTIDPTNDMPFATWEDDRSGNIDIYATSFELYGILSNAPNEDIVVTGSKQIGDSPIIYEYDIITTTNASGDVNLTVEWDSPGYTLDVASTSAYSLIFSTPSMPIDLMPGTTTEIYLYLD